MWNPGPDSILKKGRKSHCGDKTVVRMPYLLNGIFSTDKTKLNQSPGRDTVRLNEGRVTLICISKLTTINSDNGLSPGWPQAIIRTNAGILLTGPLGTNFIEIFIEIHTFSFKKTHVVWKMAAILPRPQCVNPWCAELLNNHRNILPFLNTEMSQVVEILAYGWQGSYQA